MQIFMALSGIVMLGTKVYTDVDYFGIVGNIWIVGSIIVGQINNK